ncbi:unnamed protein product, partial [Rotaria sp. Silwood2]
SILTSLEENLSEDEYFELIQTIEQHFDVMLSQSEIFYLPFIAALFITTLFKSNQMKIFAQFISAGAQLLVI